jgi:hypothetical protein
VKLLHFGRFKLRENGLPTEGIAGENKRRVGSKKVSDF